jgi:hypothetical protein
LCQVNSTFDGSISVSIRLQPLTLTFYGRRPSARSAYYQQWFWVSSLSGWLASVNTTQINNIIQEMRALAKDENTKLQVMPLEYPVKSFPRSCDMRSARVRALFIFMLSLKPLDLESGKPVDINGIVNELENRGFPSIFYRSKSELTDSPANRLLIERPPGKSVKQHLSVIPECVLDGVLQSHAIPREAYESFKKDDADCFIELRARHLAQLERNFMNSVNVMPPKEDTIFGDADIDTGEE